MKYRMYFFVPYNISDIQKGIQAGHASIEYTIQYGRLEDFRSWYINDKTWIILNGGTTRYSQEDCGSMNQIAESLLDNGIKYVLFQEPDLNNALSSICFLADERVWDKEKYPDWDDTITYHSATYSDWIGFVGGEKNVFLRELLKDKHLA
jgi:hypothetical protein